MRVAVTVVSPAAGLRADVVIDADPATPVAQVAAELDHLVHGEVAGSGARVLHFPRARPAASYAGPGIPGYGSPVAMAGGSPVVMAAGSPAAAAVAAPALFVGYHQVPGDMRLADSPIMGGSVVSVGDPAGCVRPEPAGVAEIRVASGPAAGALHRLAFGEADIGGATVRDSRTAGAADIVIADPAIAPVALRVLVDRHGCQVAPYDGVRATLDREPLQTATYWQPGQQLAIGGTLLDLARYEPPDAALHPAEDGGGFEFNRPPRLLPPERATRFALPVAPGKPERRPVPVLMAVVPIVLGVGMAYFLRQVYMLAMAAFTPVMLLGSYVSDRRGGRKSHARLQAEYREHKSRIEQDAAHALDGERVQRRDRSPDPATVLSIASGPRQRLWERRRTDPDYLLLRVGTADLPSEVELTDPARDEHRRRMFRMIPDAPVTIALPERGVVGVAGSGEAPRAAGRWLAAQIAALHSPNDVQICVLTDASGQPSWQWARWLPHCRPAEGQNCVCLIGNDAETVAARIAELLAIVTARHTALRERNISVGSFGHDIVVVFDGSRKLRSLPGAIQVLREGPQVGVYAICLDSDERLLPAESHAVAVAGHDGLLQVRQMNQPATGRVRPEYVTPAWCTLVARGMSPVRDASDDEDAAGLPDACRLLDVLGLEPPRAEAIAACWNAGGRSTLAVIGECYDGPFGIDLRKDGPHALIAGTTGAGKSELLQTIIASLACVNRPDAMTFVLVDYKGGSAFKDCVALPHTVGMVTDLDAHLTQRALLSLSAELTRRERILAAAGVKDIEDYTGLAARGRRRAHADAGHGRPELLPRLVIVIDEFASMVRDLPDFVTGLVGIAQRGRSLGIHLILATQRPSGVVSADIRANTNLRIALRMTDAAESADVIDAPDAAHISKATPGRGHVRLGHASLLPFQAGRVGGRRPGTAGATAERPWAAAVDWPGLGRPEPQRPPEQHRGEDEITDLKVLVRQIQRAAAAMRIPVQHSPWLPPLPPMLLLQDISATAARGNWNVSGDLADAVFGTDDVPELQQRRPAVVSLRTFGHLMAAGAPRSGRSQLLRTIAASIAVSCSCADVHMYGIDCGNGALLPLADLPHCGAVVTRTQTERAARLMTRLSAELARRQELLAEGGFADISEQRATAPAVQRLPHIVILLDRWEGFTTTLAEIGNGAMTDAITQILGEGASAGMHLVMTGDRSLLAGRIAAMCEDKLAFRLAEKDDYALIGLRPRDLPDDIPPGRAFRAGTGTETQVALLTPDPSGQGQAAALRQIAVWAAGLDAGVPRSLRPFRVDVLPSRITFDDAWKLRPPAATLSPLWGLAGAGGDELTALGPDLSDGMPAFAVAGPARSGRSAVLMSMTRSFLAGGAQVILVTPRPSPLRSLASLPGVIRSFEEPELGEEDLAAAAGSFTGPGAVVIDDADLLRDCEAGGELSRIISRGADRSLALVFAGDPDGLASGFGGWHIDARRARRGCLTAPQTLPEGELIGVRLTHSHIGHPVKPGNALLNTGDGNLITVTVPIL
jgi:S-DNA-T family DNA segregation ATPase FtsK/SpoIIIE